MKTRFLLLAVAAVVAQAQQREIGILGGGGFLNHLPIQEAGAAASATAGFAPGPATGVFIGQDLYSRWSGEIRYLFQWREARIESGPVKATFAGQAHVVHYDLLFHARPREAPVRPYVAMGAGVKVFRSTGAEAAYRPLMDYALLTRALEWKPMMVVGGGIKLRLGRRIQLHFDLRDQITRFPHKIISPAAGSAIGGWLHDFVPVVAVSWMY